MKIINMKIKKILHIGCKSASNSVVIHINTDTPEGREDAIRALKSNDMYCCLWEIAHNIRNRLKYRDEIDVSDVQKEIFGILTEYGVADMLEVLE